jgi:hypothetical protein
LASIQRYGQDLEEITLTLDPISREILAGPPRREADLAEAAALILRYISTASGPVTEAEIDGAIEVRRQVWKRALRDLVAGNQITRTGRGGKADPFRYSGSHTYIGNQGTGALFPDLSARHSVEDSGSQVPYRVDVSTVPTLEGHS